ncbi:glycosyltransferase family 2 protein [Aureitalea sp. L0-47]|uniref:glycosyltransferase family A protein n=1 Tax=Aureitalea sp. L0-47 TaxID=2816962 RepID=UPI0022371BE1|nr:glycosyltransferase family A protein [Aureitalea sp. L0-47]MCW5519175.1 glycosyltransferase family 2 protein [Aureitalea sp. L0-47]
MRLGRNPEKDNTRLSVDSYHRVIIPVYIPNLTEDYFRDGLKILRLSLESLLHTIHDKTRISLINNSCCEEVSAYLKNQYDTHEAIDQLLLSRINLGKVNALYSTIKSNLEPLMTVADSDVLFLPNWQVAVEEVLAEYPEAGMVSPVPSVGSLKGSFLRSTIGFAYLNGRPNYEKVKNLEGIQNFQRSIGNTKVFDEESTKYHTIDRNGVKVVLGCGHFMATIRASVFSNSPNGPSQHKIVGGSEKMYIDKPNDRGGYLKLSTHDNYGYHLGNKFESWMEERMESIRQEPGERKINSTDFSISKPSRNYYIFGYVIQKLFIR